MMTLQAFEELRARIDALRDEMRRAGKRSKEQRVRDEMGLDPHPTAFDNVYTTLPPPSTAQQNI